MSTIKECNIDGSIKATGDLSTASILSLNDIITSLNQRISLLETNATNKLTVGTAITSTTGFSMNYTIPLWAKRITALLSRVSTVGTSPICIRLGTASTGILTAGYVGSADAFATSPNATIYTNGLVLMNQNSGTAIHHIKAVFHQISSNPNTWIGHSQGMRSDTNIQEYGACSITLTDTLNQIQITTLSGNQLFDLGIVNIFYE